MERLEQVSGSRTGRGRKSKGSVRGSRAGRGNRIGWSATRADGGRSAKACIGLGWSRGVGGMRGHRLVGVETTWLVGVEQESGRVVSRRRGACGYGSGWSAPINSTSPTIIPDQDRVCRLNTGSGRRDHGRGDDQAGPGRLHVSGWSIAHPNFRNRPIGIRTLA